MLAIETRDRSAIESALRRRPEQHVYQLADLDDPFWADTRWWTLGRTEVDELALFFDRYAPPVLVALTENVDAMAVLLSQIQQQLPGTCYAHLSPGVAGCLADHFDVVNHGRHLRMGLVSCQPLAHAEISATTRLDPSHVPQLEDLYAEVHIGQPEGAVVFTSDMLALGPYFGVFEDGRLISAAGVHVHSPRQRVAAIANVATRPAARGRGFATQVTAAVCRALRPTTDHIGLLVRADNAPALRAYRKLGFETVAEYDEITLTRRGGVASERGPRPSVK